MIVVPGKLNQVLLALITLNKIKFLIRNGHCIDNLLVFALAVKFFNLKFLQAREPLRRET